MQKPALRCISDISDHILRGLRSLDPEAESRDTFLIYLLLEKVDDETKQSWARETKDNEHPTVLDFVEFLSARCDALESGQPSYSKSFSKTNNQLSSNNKTAPHNRYNRLVSNSCPKCSNDYMLHDCSEFKIISSRGIHNLG